MNENNLFLGTIIKFLLFLILSLIIFSCFTAKRLSRHSTPSIQTKKYKAAFFPPPKTTRNLVSETKFNITINDYYRWLEKSESTETKRWMKIQDNITRKTLNSITGRKEIVNRLGELLSTTIETPPIIRNGRKFFSRTLPKDDRPMYFWSNLKTNQEVALIGPNTTPEFINFSVSDFEPSWDGKRLVYMAHWHDSDIGTLHVVEVESGKELAEDRIENILKGQPIWNSDSTGFYYIYDPGGLSMPRSRRIELLDIRFHELGTDPSSDQVIMGPVGISDAFPSLGSTSDGSFLLINIRYSWIRNKLFIMDLASKNKKVHELLPNSNSRLKIYGIGKELFVLTNLDSPNGKIIALKIDSKARKHKWQEIIPEDKNFTIEHVEVIGKKFLVLLGVHNASSELRLYNNSGRLIRNIDLPTIGSIRNIRDSGDGDCFCFHFESFALPKELYKHCVSSGITKKVVSSNIKGGLEQVSVKQVFFSSYDGIKVPMFIIKRKDKPKDSDSPTILYAYGAAGISLRPFFFQYLYWWVESGGVVAVVNVRGGGELGERWHEEGRGCKKINSINDYLSAAEWLISKKYTRAGRLGAYGESAGGILVGGAITQRPELFGAAVADAPLFDMIRAIYTGPGPTFAREFGDPREKDEISCVLNYSPYQHIKYGIEYPAALFAAGERDDRVDPMHVRKTIASLQFSSSAKNTPYLFLLKRGAGHSVSSSRSVEAELQSDFAAFFASRLMVDQE